MLAVGLFLHFVLCRGCGEAASRTLGEIDLRRASRAANRVRVGGRPRPPLEECHRISRMGLFLRLSALCPFGKGSHLLDSLASFRNFDASATLISDDFGQTLDDLRQFFWRGASESPSDSFNRQGSNLTDFGP